MNPRAKGEMKGKGSLNCDRQEIQEENILWFPLFLFETKHPSVLIPSLVLLQQNSKVGHLYQYLLSNHDDVKSKE